MDILTFYHDVLTDGTPVVIDAVINPYEQACSISHVRHLGLPAVDIKQSLSRDEMARLYKRAYDRAKDEVEFCASEATDIRIDERRTA